MAEPRFRVYAKPSGELLMTERGVALLVLAIAFSFAYRWRRG